MQPIITTVREVLDKETKARGNRLERPRIQEKVAHTVVNHPMFRTAANSSTNAKKYETLLAAVRETNDFLSTPAITASKAGMQARRALIGGMAGDGVKFPLVKGILRGRVSRGFLTDCRKQRENAIRADDPSLL